MAKIIGMIVASFSAVMYGPLHHHQLEKEKKAALALNKGDFDRRMTLSHSTKSELRWWVDNKQKRMIVYCSWKEMILCAQFQLEVVLLFCNDCDH